MSANQPYCEMTLLLDMFNSKYPIKYLKRINELLMRVDKQTNEKLIHQIMKSSFITSVTILLTSKQYNFENLFYGIVYTNGSKFVPQVLRATIQQFCDNEDINYDDALKLHILKLLAHLSSYAHPHEIKQLSNTTVPPLTKILMTKNISNQVKAETIFTLANLAYHCKKTIHRLMGHGQFMGGILIRSCTTNLIQTLMDFLAKCATTEFPRLNLTMCHDEATAANDRKIKIHSEMVRFMCNIQLVGGNWGENEIVKKAIIALLSMIKECDKNQIYNKQSYIHMIYRIAVTSRLPQIHILKFLFEAGLVREIVEYLQRETSNKMLQHVAIKTLAHILKFREIGQNKVMQLINDGLLNFIETIIKSRDLFYSADKKGIQMKKITMQILENIIENYIPLIEYLFNDDRKILQYISRISVMKCAQKEHCNGMMRIICRCIINADIDKCGQDILHYYHQDLFMNFMMHRMFSNQTDDKTIVLISKMIKRMTRYFNDEVNILIMEQVHVHENLFKILAPN